MTLNKPKSTIKLVTWLAFFFVCFNGNSQNLSITGTVYDTTGNEPVKNAVVMAVRLSDSLLVSHTRSKADGTFLLPNTPIDTFQIIIQSPGFGEPMFIVFGDANNREVKLGRVVLPPKSLDMNEVVIYGYKDPVYFKGDTIIYTADSFNVKQNANVEDLLKKLPGITVDKSGNIKSRGKEVSQVLVDGDEFFGSDPTMATKNLYAESVESVQVYDKKNDQAGASTGETITVMDLKLKDDAKKGHFGKVSGGTDFSRFYETQILANKFTKKQKISVFGLASNTPKSSFGYDDSYRYGIENENLTITETDEGIIQYYSGNRAIGFPTTNKAGFYFNDKLSERSKLNANYSFKQNQLQVNEKNYSQYFLADTSYSTDNTDNNGQRTDVHQFNLKYSTPLDSATTLDLEPSLSQSKNKVTKQTINRFLSSEGEETRKTNTLNNNQSESTDFGTKITVTRKFSNPDRKLSLKNTFNYSEKSNTGLLYTDYKFNSNLFNDSVVDQQKIGSSLERVNRTLLSYTEPLSKKIKVELNYDLTFGNAYQVRESFNKQAGEYQLKDSLFSNEFNTKRTNNQLSGALVYETKKTRISIGSKVRQNIAQNDNLANNTYIKQTVQNVLPYVYYRFKASDNRQITINYTSNSNTPSVQQLQPVPDNSNPNFIRLGNPNLLPTFVNTFGVNYYTYSALKNNHFYTGLQANFTNNDFSTSTSFDQFGRTTSLPINVNGNYNAYGYAGGRSRVVSGILFLNYQFNLSTYGVSNFINGEKNKTTGNTGGTTLSLEVEKDELEAGITFGADLTQTASTLNNQSNQPYGSTRFGANIEYNFKKGFYVESAVTHTRNSRRTAGYNLNFTIWNATINKKFLAKENLIAGIEANDILNQNISSNRSIQGNVIVDTKTSIIGRYILLKLTYKFDSNKEKISDEEDFY